MGGSRLFTPLLGGLLWLILMSAGAAAAAMDKADVRVLIDISGSMKQNDPKNLRRPALRLLVGLLPQDTRAGVWTFAKYVNRQIPLARVDDKWRARARARSHMIGSPGQFTHIEAALQQTTTDWQGPARQQRRSIVLLTDGMVDISRDVAKNQASRQRILEQVVPRLQALGASVHTIALSENADHALMRALAQSTDGWYEQVDDAEQLQKVFLRIFEKVGRPDTVPLQDNQFTIDASVTEATLLVFHRQQAKPTQLITPDGITYNAKTAPRLVTWHQDLGYDMLTIKQPQAGEWKIVGELDPDNRVIVVTDLRMHTTELPNRLIQGESLPIEVTFTDHGRLITKPAFLDVLKLTATQQDVSATTDSKPILDNGQVPDTQAGDGRFTLQFGGDELSRGVGELVINAEGQTFVREKRITYEVVPPVILAAIPAQQANQVLVRVSPDETLVEASTLQTSVWLSDGQGKRIALEMTRNEPGVSEGSIDLMDFSGTRKLFVQAMGKTKEGGTLSYLDSPIEVEGLLPPPVTPIATTAPKLPEPEAIPAQATQTAQQPVQHDWLFTARWLALFNLMLLTLGGAGLWWVRKLNKRQVIFEEVPASFNHASPEEQAA